MKQYSVIQMNLAHIRSEVVAKKHIHAKLHQIDMLSSEGNKLREEINKLKGMAIALEWILEDSINGDLIEQKYYDHDME